LLFVGDDWAEDHHNVEIQDESGRRLAKARLPEGVAGMARLHALLGDHLDADAGTDQVAVGIETDRGAFPLDLQRPGSGGPPSPSRQERTFHAPARSRS